GSLTNVANTLMQLGQQRLATQFLELVVHHHALEPARARNLAAARAADEQVAFPGGDAIGGVEREARRRDRGNPQHEWLFDAGTERHFGNACTLVGATETELRPSVVAPWL